MPSTPPSAKRIVIVGGVAGGAAAATRARRLSEDAEIILFERGEHISFANCGLPYHVGGVIASREALLVQTPERMRARYAIDVRTRTEVIAIDRDAREVTVRDAVTGAESTQGYDRLILSPGAAPVRPGIDGADDPAVLTLRNLADMDAIKAEDVEALSMNTQNLTGVELELEVPSVLENNVWVSDSLNTTDDTKDYFAFDALAGEFYTLDINRSTASYAQMILLDRNGFDDLVMIYDWQSQINWWCPTNGRYYIKVSDPEWYHYGGSYQIHMLSNIDLPSADISGPQWVGVKDGRVNLNDFSLLATHWLSGCSSPYWCQESDYDESGIVDLADLTTLLNEWMETTD